MRNLLVPTDFSDEALCSLHYALAFARDLGATVHVLNSYYIPVATIDADYVADQALWLEQARQRAQEEMALLEKQHLQHSGITYSCMVHPGPAMSDINQTIKEKEIDLVVMGSYDTGELTGFFGDFYTYAIRHAKSPALLVPHPCHYTRPSRIAFAADLNPFDSQDVIVRAREILIKLGAETIVLHIHKAGERLNHDQQHELNQLMQGFSGIRAKPLLLEAPDAEAGIQKFVQEQQPHWIITVAHRYGFLEKLFRSSHTKKLARNTDVPLLVLHDKASK